MRHGPLLLTGLLLLTALAGCGDDATSGGARARLLVSEVDGAIEGEVKFLALDSSQGRVFDTRPLDGDPLVRVAPGAPPGRYRVFTTASWGMLWTGQRSTAAPVLADERYPPTTVRLGKPRSLYIAALDPSLPSSPVGTVWAAEAKRAADGGAVPFQRVAVEVVDQGEGIVAVRFPPEAWHLGNVLRLVGRMSDGSVTQMLSYVVRDEHQPDLPRITLVSPAAPAPLTVHLVPPPGMEQVPDGLKATITLLDIPLDAVYEEVSYQGAAQFDTVAALGHAIRVALPDSGSRCAFDLDQEDWRLRQSIYIVAQHTQAGQATEVVIGGARFVEARVGYQDGSTFGRVPLEAFSTEPPRARLVTQPGWQDWWLRSAEGLWYHHVLEVDTEDGREVAFVAAAGGKSAHVRGSVQGGGARHRVLLTQIQPAFARDGVEILPERRLGGDGLEAAVSGQGEYELRVPPGRYELQVHGPAGPVGRPRTMEFRAGQETRLDLAAR